MRGVRPSTELRTNGYSNFIQILSCTKPQRGRCFVRSDVIKTAILLPLLLGLIILTGCMVGPDYKEPKMQMSEKFANESEKGLTKGEVETLWWRGFNDEKLNHLVELAIADNYDLRIATANLREARALRLETQFDLYPTVTSQASYTRERLSKAQTRGQSVGRDLEPFQRRIRRKLGAGFFRSCASLN